ncbi:MAG TPA: trehalose-phosphatase [Ktedonosporobacter sp.]|nr:trehalose-phosphatase [Ktedonosporobacter sp.]
MTSIDLSTLLSRRPLGLVFDIDGTLSPMTPKPDTARLWPGVAENLMRARQCAHVAILTGRAIGDGARIVNLEGLTYIGTHGLEWSNGLPTTQSIQLLPEAQAYVESGKYLFDLLEQHLDELPGVILQRKTVGGSVHYRLSPNPEQTREQLFALLEEPARRLHMRLGEGRLIVEILAPLAINKGEALRRYAQRYELQGIIFAGDDRTDLDAVLEVKQLRGQGLTALSMVVCDADTLPALLEHGDILINGVEGMAEQLQMIVTLLEQNVRLHNQHDVNSPSKG